MTEHDIRRAAALAAIVRAIPKTLENMATAWTERAQDHDDAVPGFRRERLEQAAAYAEGVRDAQRACAKELREYVATWKHAGEKP